MTSPARRGRAIAALAVAAALVAACAAPGGATDSPSPTRPAGSGATACPTAPQPPDNLEGWGPRATAPTVVPYLITTAGELACGANRVLFTILDKSGTPIGAPDRTAKVSLFDLGRDPSKAIASAEGTFIWAIEDVRGIYVVNVTFPEAGRYGLEVTTSAGGGAPVTERLTFDVQPSSPVVKVGDRAPASKTPTLAEVGDDPAKISTDQHPEPAFYRTSVDRAIADHKPFVLIFATPKFCTSAQCGPTLDRIKPYLAKYPGVTFINVEPYELKLVDGSLTAVVDSQNALVATAVTNEWHLFSEPNVYVVNRDGIVTANFELIFSDAELTAALDAVK